jgi:hypothetical protein
LKILSFDFMSSKFIEAPCNHPVCQAIRSLAPDDIFATPRHFAFGIDFSACRHAMNDRSQYPFYPKLSLCLRPRPCAPSNPAQAPPVREWVIVCDLPWITATPPRKSRARAAGRR